MERDVQRTNRRSVECVLGLGKQCAAFMWMGRGWLFVDDRFCGDVQIFFLLPVAGVNGFLSDMFEK